MYQVYLNEHIKFLNIFKYMNIIRHVNMFMYYTLQHPETHYSTLQHPATQISKYV